jgi:hypothetical protein
VVWMVAEKNQKKEIVYVKDPITDEKRREYG